MKRLAAGAVTLALGALLAAGTASAGTPSGGQPSLSPRAQLTGFSCHRALNPANRSISVTAVMRPLTGTEHMALRFNLLSTSPLTGITTAVHFGDLGTWKTPKNPTLGQLPGDVWSLQKSVYQLVAPASYRFRVMFRWTGHGGRVIGTAVRLSSRCHQVELRPDLLVSSISVAPISGDPADNLYTAVIANDGNSGAGPFEVLFAPADGSAPKTRTVQLLRGHTSTMLSFLGPVCTSSTDPTVTADSTDEVDDLNRANNSLTATCPAS
ncbi:MAG: CARDB domain-containing protein [Solirubrobacteraceae bacterium]